MIDHTCTEKVILNIYQIFNSKDKMVFKFLYKEEQSDLEVELQTGSAVSVISQEDYQTCEMGENVNVTKANSIDSSSLGCSYNARSTTTNNCLW